MDKAFSPSGEGVKIFDNKEQARDWLKDKYKIWQKHHLFDKTEQFLNDYTNPKKSLKLVLNDYLIETGGKLIKKSDPEYSYFSKKYPLDIEKINEIIEAIDEAILNAKVPETMRVYERVDETSIGLERNTLRDKQGIISLPMWEKTLQEIPVKKTFNKSDYFNGNLRKNYEYNKFPILFEYLIPKGINGAYFYNEDNLEPEMIINRGQKFEIERVSIIDEINVKTLKIEVKLI